MTFQMAERHFEFFQKRGGILVRVTAARQRGRVRFQFKHALPTLYDVPIGFSELFAIVEHEASRIFGVRLHTTRHSGGDHGWGPID